MGCSALPAEFGGFQQVSGLTYEIDKMCIRDSYNGDWRLAPLPKRWGRGHELSLIHI